MAVRLDGTGAEEIRVDPPNLRQLLADLKQFEPKLVKSLRAGLRKAGTPMVKEMQAEVRKATTGGRSGKNAYLRSRTIKGIDFDGSVLRERESYTAHRGTREAIARGIGLRIAPGVRTPGIRVVSAGSTLDPSRKAMVKAFNRTTFRHPVFGNRNDWVNQSGRPYFGAVIDRHREAFQKAVEEAIAAATKTLENRY